MSARRVRAWFEEWGAGYGSISFVRTLPCAAAAIAEQRRVRREGHQRMVYAIPRGRASDLAKRRAETLSLFAVSLNQIIEDLREIPLSNRRPHHIDHFF